MNLFVNRVPRPVYEMLAVTGFRDGLAGHLVNLPTVKNFPSGITLLGLFDRRITPVTYDIENLLMLRRHSLADKEGPCNVVVDCVGHFAFGPHIDKEKIALLHRQVVFKVRRVMRISTVRIDCDDRRMTGSEIAPVVFLQNKVLYLNLGNGSFVQNPSSD